MTKTSHPQTHSKRANSVKVGEHVPRKWPNWLSSFAAWVLTKRGWRVEGELINQKKAMGAIVKRLGGIPIERSKAHGVVTSIANKRSRLLQIR